MTEDELKGKINAVKEKVNAFMDEKGINEKIDAGKEKIVGAIGQERIDAGKEKAKAGMAEAKKRISLLPFRNMLEKKVPSETREKFPILNKLIPLTNFIFVALVALVVVAAVPKGGSSGGGRPNSAKDFSFDLTEDGKGIRITGYNGRPGKVVVPARVERLPVVEIGGSVFRGQTTTYNLGTVKI